MMTTQNKIDLDELIKDLENLNYLLLFKNRKFVRKNLKNIINNLKNQKKS